jgi:hypothetical protein
MKSFEILHFSYRKWNSYHEQGCYKINLVFRAFEVEEYSYIKERFLNETREWQEGEIVQDLDLHEKYMSGIRMFDGDTGRDLLTIRTEEEKEQDDRKYIPITITNDNNIEREEVYTKGYKENWNSMFEYIEKFDCFRFHEYFKINPVTKGIIQYIEELKELDDTDTYYAEQLYCALKSLEYWWD